MAELKIEHDYTISNDTAQNYYVERAIWYISQWGQTRTRDAWASALDYIRKADAQVDIARERRLTPVEHTIYSEELQPLAEHACMHVFNGNYQEAIRVLVQCEPCEEKETKS